MRCSHTTHAAFKETMEIPSECSTSVPITEVPPSSQLLRTTPISGQRGDEKQFELKEVAWGVPYEPHEFVSVACQKGHPKNFENLLPKVLKDSIDFNCKNSLGDIVDFRARWFKKWIDRSRKLSNDERILKSKLPDHLAQILAPKRILLWAEMLKEAGYPDLGVIEELIDGTSLVGPAPPTGIFESKFRPADMTVDQLKNSSHSERTRNFYSSRSSGDDEVDKVVYDKTLEEVASGWAIGPLRLEDMPNHCVLSRRFGLRQPNKIRLIDDLSGSLVNSSVQSEESPKPHTTDVVAAIALALLKKCNSQVLGRAFDLKAAYRQLGIHPDSLWAAYVVVFNFYKRVAEIFQLQAVPFGATRSVFSFLRIAYSLWWLGCSQLKIMWSSFYDDFKTFSLKESSENTEASVRLFFDLLGWRFAVDGDKASEFSLSFSALGIVVNLEHFLEGWVEFCNTTKRSEELAQAIQHMIDSGTMSLLESQRLRGRMQFAEGQLFGRIGQLCLRAVSNHGFSGLGPKLRVDCIRAMKRFRDFLCENNPRRIMNVSSNTWYVYTDACYEPTAASWKCGIGGVIYNPSGEPVEFFSMSLSDLHIESLGGRTKETIIFEAELLALVVAMSEWSHLFQGCPVVFFVDNKSSRDVAISGSARNDAAANTTTEASPKVEVESSAFAWYARVPSPSNPSDELSRGCLDSFLSGSILRVDVHSWVDEITKVLQHNRLSGGDIL